MNTLLQRLIGLTGTQRVGKSFGCKLTHRVLTFLWLSLMLMAGLAQAGPASTEVTYYHNDLLGSPVAATNDQGELIWRKSYKPYGEEIESTAESEEEFVGYTGHRLDKETGLVYAGARYYDPVIGRFMGYDPVGFVGSSPQSFNRYAYGNNNPYIYVDPNGETPAHIFKFAADVALNVAINYATTGEANVGGALADSALNIVNPLSSLQKANKLRKIIGKGKGGKPGPKPNNGVARQHGNTNHDNAIDNRISILKQDSGVSNIRKNQQQVDVNGNKVGTNRPDIQFDKGGCHHCVEFDNVGRNSVKHGQVIRKNDPKTKVELNRL